MIDLRHRPGAFTQDPRGANGLRGRSAVDMIALNPWGELAAFKQGACAHWWFVCANGHEFLLNGAMVRAQALKGISPTCRDCVASGAVPKRGSR